MNISFEQFNKITIKNYSYYKTVEDFKNALTLTLPREGGGRIGTLLWANGLLFRHVPFSPTDSITKEYIQGHLPLDSVDFTLMESFENELYFKQFTIVVQNMSNNIVLSELSKWIKENLINKNIEINNS